ncbi:hypothetical protein TI39_contig402g00012 [Zymoseptoria brevis]|uniref:Uncharacterized protein n=1 Tax=Zymoseptoria brevis TaxID=1047168 RepID=A0A0F4GMI3_9PEZI|nr:hypothetical protein TI39_contig402g00012 [Zymoseptoria brevis]
MESTFETMVRRDVRSRGHICATLRRFLDDGRSLYQLRRTSKTMRALTDRAPGMLFQQLYAKAPFPSSDRLSTLTSIAAHCHHLAIQIGEPPQTRRNKSGPSKLITRWKKGPSSTIPRKSSTTTLQAMCPHPNPAHLVDRRLGTYLFQHLTHFQTLTLRVHGNPAWPGCTLIESTLITLRLSLERAQVRTLRSLTVSPIHISGILHLRWSPLGAFVEPPSASASAGLWQSLTSLTLHLRNPTHTGELSFAQAITATKLLQDYLGSFSATLRRLQFIWLDAEGPSPLLLDDEAGMETRRVLSWPVLEEFRFGNLTAPYRTLLQLRQRAPNVEVVKALRSTHRGAGVRALGEGAWIRVDVEEMGRRWGGKGDTRASSIYSQEGMGGERSGSSSLSGVEPFVFEGWRVLRLG